MLWIALHLPWLSLESFVQTLPPAESEAVPVALLEDHQISVANALAQAAGVRPGMKRATALALLPHLLLGQADAARDAQALIAVARAALAFTPSVTLEGPGTVLMDVQASLRLFGGLRRLLRELQAAIAPLRHHTRIATAPTALGAALLAAWRDDLTLGTHTTDPAALRRLLDEAPIWLVGRGREHWQALQGMGLTHLSDLRHLPRTGLARRFGPDLLLDLDHAHGDAPDPRGWIGLPRRFEAKLELFARADHSAQVLHGAQVLMHRMLAWAQAWHARIAGFTLALHHETRLHHSTYHENGADPADPPHDTALPIVLSEASADPRHLHTLLAERLARMTLPAPVLELGLVCDDLVDTPAPNGELFHTRASERQGLMRLIDRLQARLGNERIRAVQTVADHRPECDTIEVPFRSQAVTRPGASSPGPVPRRPLMRPIWLLTEPRPLKDDGTSPMLDGAPLRLLAGPERVESGWWEEGKVNARDYFIAEAADGALVWIYRPRLPVMDAMEASVGWFLHGRFG